MTLVIYIIYIVYCKTTTSLQTLAKGIGEESQGRKAAIVDPHVAFGVDKVALAVLCSICSCESFQSVISIHSVYSM